MASHEYIHSHVDTNMKWHEHVHEHDGIHEHDWTYQVPGHTPHRHTVAVTAESNPDIWALLQPPEVRREIELAKLEVETARDCNDQRIQEHKGIDEWVCEECVLDCVANQH